MPYIYYTGVGAKASGMHSVAEFLAIMEQAPMFYRASTYLGFDMEYKNYHLPDDYARFTLQDWLEYTGADYYDQEWDY